MKRASTTLAAMFLAITVTLNGSANCAESGNNHYLESFEVETRGTQFLSTNPVTLYYNALSIQYERVIGNSSSLSWDLTMNVFGNAKSADTEFSVFEVGMMYKNHFGDDAASGIWCGFRASYLKTDYGVTGSSKLTESASDMLVEGRLGRTFTSNSLFLSAYVSYAVELPIDKLSGDGSPDLPMYGGLFFGLDLGIALSLR